LNKNVREGVDRIRGIGTNFTFEGDFLADFVERLDVVLDIQGIEIDEAALRLLVGEPKTASKEDLLRVVTKACLLNVAAAGYEDTDYGKVLYFEFYIPPWSETVL
jgi:hypothetical protein